MYCSLISPLSLSFPHPWELWCGEAPKRPNTRTVALQSEAWGWIRNGLASNIMISPTVFDGVRHCQGLCVCVIYRSFLALLLYLFFFLHFISKHNFPSSFSYLLTVRFLLAIAGQLKACDCD